MLALLLIVLSTAAHAHAEFRAASVKVDITPTTPQWLMGYGARQSTAIHDPIFHRIAILDDGKTQVIVVASDLCVFSPGVFDETVAELKLDPKQLWWTVTHTHSAPEVGPPGVYDVLLKGRSEHAWSREYLAFTKAKLAEGIAAARAKLAPARMVTGVGRANANINRRARDLDGSISLGYNPDGPVDRQIGLVRLEDAGTGKIIALIANYAMHGTALGGQWMEISGDAPSAAINYVEQQLGATVLYVNGAAGNIAPIYTTQANPRAAHLPQFRVLLGEKILAANATLGGATAPAALRLSEKIVETPRRADIGWPAELGQYAAKSPAGADLIRIPVRMLAIGDTVLWGAPVELFCEISMRVREDSPFRHTFFFGYMNGWLGYLPTAAAFAEGGYEPRTSPFTPAVERHFTEGVSNAIAGLRESTGRN